MLADYRTFCHIRARRSYLLYMQGYLRAKSFLSSLKSFVSDNKKVIICAVVIFVLGITVGIISAFRAVGEDGFERVARADMEFGAAKVFFISLLALIGCYGVFLIAGVNNVTVFLIILPFFALGFITGEYSATLIARYETTGLINLLLIYLPFFLCTFCCFVLCATVVVAPDCSCCKTGLKPSFVSTMKILGVNVAIAFVLFIILGSIFKVIVVSLY